MDDPKPKFLGTCLRGLERGLIGLSMRLLSFWEVTPDRILEIKARERARAQPPARRPDRFEA